MKRIFIIIMIPFLMASGCASKNSFKPKNNAFKQWNKECEAGTKENFEKLSYNQIPKKLLDSINVYKKYRGYFTMDLDEWQYIVVLAGRRNTGGYSLEFLDAYEKDGSSIIIVKEKTPSPKDIVTQAITYPYLVLRTHKHFESYKVIDENGNIYDKVQNVSGEIE